MNKETHAPMPRSQRAKQFAPFAALKGLPEALAQKERPRVTKRELSEERKSEINDVLKRIRRGIVVTAVYYDHIQQEYIQITGATELVDEQRQRIFIGNTEIFFDDLLGIGF